MIKLSHEIFFNKHFSKLFLYIQTRLNDHVWLTIIKFATMPYTNYDVIIHTYCQCCSILQMRLNLIAWNGLTNISLKEN